MDWLSAAAFSGQLIKEVQSFASKQGSTYSERLRAAIKTLEPLDLIVQQVLV
jgi:hypothetical protein